MDRRARRSQTSAGWTLVATSLLFGGSACHRPTESPAPPVAAAQNDSAERKADQTPLFIDVTDSVGLHFRHDPGATGELLLPEVMGGGAALFDFDRDGDLDIFLVQGGPLEDRSAGSKAEPRAERPNHRLYRNDLDPQGGNGLRFTDVTQSSGIQANGYGMGVATGDFNNDGLVDLYVTNLGSNQMLHNLSGGRFRDVTDEAGVDDKRWSTSATFFDYDRDGWLDLFVANYVDFQRAKSPVCHAPSSARDYCGPDAYSAVSDSLFHNLKNGRFENVSQSAGFSDESGAGLGVVAADLNHDGWCDLYVANDGDPNQLWINRAGQGIFTNEALLAGAALNIHGQAEAGMGVDAADCDGDGDEDLFVTNLAGESNTLYVNLGDGLFEDRTIPLNLHAPSLPFTSFGTRFIDFDHDGDLDLFAMNGAVRLQGSLVATGDPYPLRQTSQLFRNGGAAGFQEVSTSAGSPFVMSEVSRGAAIGDVDNDGDVDMLITNNGGPARLLLSTIAQRTHWLGLRLVDARFGQDVLQARMKILCGDDPPLWRRVHTDGSYLSASDARTVVGLGEDVRARNVVVYWPDGLVETWSNLEADRYHVLTQTKGTRTAP